LGSEKSSSPGCKHKLQFSWVSPIIKLGNERILQLNDLCKVIPEDESEFLGLQLERFKQTQFYKKFYDAIKMQTFI